MADIQRTSLQHLALHHLALVVSGAYVHGPHRIVTNGEFLNGYHSQGTVEVQQNEEPRLSVKEPY